jgi:hypothetical protein
MSKCSNDYRQQIINGLPDGCVGRVEHKGRHPRLVIQTDDGRSLVVIIPFSPTNSWRSSKQTLSLVRRSLRQGASA